MCELQQIYIYQVEGAKDLPVPGYKTQGSVGMDLYAAVNSKEKRILKPGERDLIPTGIKIQLPFGFEAVIRPRSGLAVEYGITVLNSPGTIDSDYRGEIKVVLINHGKEEFEINRGMRIAQMVINKTERLEVKVVNEFETLKESKRGEGGFGHTGKY